MLSIDSPLILQSLSGYVLIPIPKNSHVMRLIIRPVMPFIGFIVDFMIFEVSTSRKYFNV